MIRPRSSWRVAAPVLVLLALGACGVDAGDAAAPSSDRTTTTAAGPQGAPDPAEPTTTTTADDEPATTATTAAERPDDGTVVEGDGWAIDRGPTWEDLEGGLARGIEYWGIGPADDGFQANVNVLVQDATTGVEDLDGYVELSEGQFEALDAELIDSSRVAGSEGQQLARLEFTADQMGAELHFLAYATEVEGGFALATFTSPADRYDDLVGEVEPYLATIRAAG